MQIPQICQSNVISLYIEGGQVQITQKNELRLHLELFFLGAVTSLLLTIYLIKRTA